MKHRAEQGNYKPSVNKNYSLRTFTLKNYITYLAKYAGTNSYKLTLTGNQTKIKYNFTIQNGIKLVISKHNVDKIMFMVNSMEDLQLEDTSFTPEILIETKYKPDGSIYSEQKNYIVYVAQLYIQLFRLMKERVNFVFIDRNKYYYCYYVDGKVLYAEETEDSYIIKGTNLFKLSESNPEYEILYVSQSVDRPSYATFMDSSHKCSILKNKKFVKYKFNIQI